jgi:hypothetical protein
MKIDMTTNIDREMGQIGMTADHTSRPDKVLFFANPHFLFFNLTQPTLAHLPLPSTTQADTRAKSKEPILHRFNNFS